MIKIDNISKIYPSRADNGTIVALDNVSFKINKDEFISLTGKSGSGKTTILKLILGEEDPTEGSVFFDDFDVSQMRKSQISQMRRRIGTVFQDYRLFPKKTAAENIAYVMEVMGASNKEIQNDLTGVLEIVGLTDRAHNFPHELSGGERQRVAIARALIHRPDVILADEPTGNLDPYNTSEVVRLLLKIYKLGTTVILATHDRELINHLGKRVITLEKGRVIRDEEKGRFVL